MNFRLLCLAFLLPCLGYGQIVIERADMPQSGDTVRVASAATTGFAARVTATGPDFRWDFSDLQPQENRLVNYQPAFQTPYLFYFLTAYGQKTTDTLNLFVVNLTQLYDFYNLNNNRFATIGRGFSLEGIPLPANYSDPDEIFFLPISYGRTDNSTYAFEVAVPTLGAYQSQGQRTTEVDGWGEITTPAGTFDCLRLKSTVRIIDSIEFNGINLGLPARTEVEYYWLAKGEKAPILKVSGTTFFGTFNPTAVQFRYSPPPLSPQVKVQVPAGKAVLYPNPTLDKLFIAVHPIDRIQAVLFYDEFGRLVRQSNGYPAVGFDVYEWQSGLYTVQIFGSYGVYTEKVLIMPR